MFLKGFAGDISKAQSRASMVAGEAVSNIRTVAAFNAEKKVLALFERELEGPMKAGFLRGQVEKSSCYYFCFGGLTFLWVAIYIFFFEVFPFH
jgi:ATP-binding cassette subfamily B (MDR/TAP) protein 1